ncbi:hypothetical protein [Domibacillus antri]|nr:hypothetical protein [Domibacillus antri]
MGKNQTGLSLEQVIEIASKTAVSEALTFLEKEKKRQQKQKRDRRLRNTKLLLRNYRSLKLHCADLRMEIADLDQELDRVLEADELDTDAFAIESIRRSKKRTLAMVSFVDRMLAVYETVCQQSGKEEDLRRFQTIYQMYISPDKKTAAELAERHYTNIRTVYKDVDSACKTLSGLIFGIDSITFH